MIQDNTFLITIPCENPSGIKVDGTILIVNKHEKGLTVEIHHGYLNHILVELNDSNITIDVPDGGVIPLYYRKLNNTFFISNVQHKLVQRNEKLKIYAQVLYQCLHGAYFPISNIFVDIKQLNSSCIYEIQGTELIYKKTAFTNLSNPNPEYFFNFLNKRFEAYFNSDPNVAVLLSGGYDSRLNTLMAKYVAPSVATINLFHEYKDKDEFDVANKVANYLNIPLVTKTRKDFSYFAKTLLNNKEFILFNGLQRHNIPRWAGYLDFINNNFNNPFIIGFGAEAHKGKYYSQIHDLNKDGIKCFGSKPKVITKIASYFKFTKYENVEESFFDKIISASVETWTDLYSQIDFLHYQTYIVNGYSCRSHYLFLEHGIDFPLFDRVLLNNVFSLKREEKEGFKLVKDAINRLDPNISSIGYISGNVKSIKKKSHDPLQRFFNLISRIKGVYTSRFVTHKSIDWESFPSPNTEITSKIYKYLKSPDYLVECKIYEVEIIYRYLVTLENEYSVDYELI